jgi:hypothetical protein
MSDTYKYEDGAIHHDHKKVLHIDNVNGNDMGKLISAFFKDDAEDAVIVSEEKNPELTALEDAEEVHAEVDISQYDAELIEKLKPIFYNNEGDVRLFLKELSGMKSGDITDLVNRWVKEKRISDYGYSRKGLLWEILNDAGLYTKSRQNWCKRVD